MPVPRFLGIYLSLQVYRIIIHIPYLMGERKLVVTDGNIYHLMDAGLMVGSQRYNLTIAGFDDKALLHQVIQRKVAKVQLLVIHIQESGRFLPISRHNQFVKLKGKREINQIGPAVSFGADQHGISWYLLAI